MPNEHNQISEVKQPHAEKSPGNSTDNSKTDLAGDVTGENAPAIPDWLPKKFWDAEKGEIRVRALVKSYRSLERRLSSVPPLTSPLASPLASISKPEAAVSVDKPMDKPIDRPVDNPVGNPDKPVDKTESAVGEANILEGISEPALAEAFGGLEKWQKLRPRLLAWSRHNLPRGAYEVFSGSIDGIRMLHRMMNSTSSEPQLIEGGDVPQALDESRLRRMMQDPRYWRDRNPEFINRVLHGFRQLYEN